MNVVPSTNGTSKPTKTVTGQYIAKAYRTYPAWDRAEDAARWLRGELQIKPTVKLAAATFGVTIPMLVKARDHLARLGEWRDRNKHRNGTGTTTLSDEALDRIVVEAGALRVMHSIARGVARGTLPEVTDFQMGKLGPDPVPTPEASLQAAE
jgi:hypothetical protein